MRKPAIDETPTLAETIRTVIDSALVELHTSLPAKIVSYNAAKQLADVQPTLKRRYEDDADAKPLPVIPNVPVRHPVASGGSARIHMPVKAGDPVLLIFCERSLDRWKGTTDAVDPGDRRRHDLTDAFALVGGGSPAAPFSVTDADAIEVVIGSAVMQLKADGTVNVGSATPGFSIALAERVLARLQEIETKFGSFVGAYNGHTHTGVLAGPAVTGPTAATATSVSPPGGSLASSKAKVIA